MLPVLTDGQTDGCIWMLGYVINFADKQVNKGGGLKKNTGPSFTFPAAIPLFLLAPTKTRF